MFSQIPFYLLFLVSLILGAEGKGGGGGKVGRGVTGSKKTGRVDPEKAYPNIAFIGTGPNQYCKDKTT